MGSSVAGLVWRDVVGKRWIRCGVWQAVIASFVWLVWEFVVISRSSRRSYGDNQVAISFPFLWRVIRFLLFQASQVFFLLGQTFVSEPGEREPASLGDLAGGLLKLLVRAVIGRSHDESPLSSVSELRNKIWTTLDMVSFAIMCIISGTLGCLSLLPPVTVVSCGWANSLDIALRGGCLGLFYAGLQIYRKKVNLSFPIIQRRLLFAFKMGIPPAAMMGIKVALTVLPFAEAVARFFLSESGNMSTSIVEHRGTSFWWQMLLLAAGTSLLTFCWEVSHHLVQVFLTKRHIFAPPLGSPAAETDPTELLLLVLEDPETSSLVLHHTFLDLCTVSETNVDTWRRAAFFEETGDTYTRLIGVCLKRLDNLTIKLAQGLEGHDGNKAVSTLHQQMQSPQAEHRQLALESTTSHFRDYQLCVWSARIVASLTASSRFEDRYGVAQLHDCNAAVVSSLLSCLLVVEVYLGRRSTARGASFVPNSIKWTVPSRGAFMEVGKRQGYPFGKRSALHKKAYAMGDVLRTCIYQIVSAFGEEMVLAGSGGKGYSVAGRDWLSRKKPLYGAHEIHLQKLSMFLDYQVG